MKHSGERKAPARGAFAVKKIGLAPGKMQTPTLSLGSLFSGIEGFGLGFERTGKFKIQWQVEQDAFCNRVLGDHWPAVPRHADVCKVGRKNLAKVDCITAGVPCQDVSIAGRRAGLAGKRTGLFYEFARILRELRPTWFVFENVPGLFSSDRGRDFGKILRVLMVECGYGVSWRVLDSRYFGVAQRRRRVFVVGYFGKPCPPEILFEREGGAWHPASRGEAWASLAGSLAAGTHASGFNGRDAENGNIVAGTINSRHSPNGHGAAGPRVEDIPNLVAHSLSSHGSDRYDPNGNDYIAAPLTSGSHPGSNAPGRRNEDDFNLCVIQDCRGRRENRQNGIGISEGGPCYSLTKVDRHAVGFNVSAPPNADGVRDFAGLPPGMDDPESNALLPRGEDSPRYRALGNAVTQTVAYWIAKRIVAFEFPDTQEVRA
jgi:DNA (cytosine-5)-methyltransferase 1